MTKIRKNNGVLVADWWRGDLRFGGSGSDFAHDFGKIMSDVRTDFCNGFVTGFRKKGFLGFLGL